MRDIYIPDTGTYPQSGSIPSPGRAGWIARAPAEPHLYRHQEQAVNPDALSRGGPLGTSRFPVSLDNAMAANAIESDTKTLDDFDVADEGSQSRAQSRRAASGRRRRRG